MSKAKSHWKCWGGRLPAPGPAGGTTAAFGPDGSLIALVTGEAGALRPLAVFVP